VVTGPRLARLGALERLTGLAELVKVVVVPPIKLGGEVADGLAVLGEPGAFRVEVGLRLGECSVKLALAVDCRGGSLSS
jgi:hypothetical protein